MMAEEGKERLLRKIAIFGVVLVVVLSAGMVFWGIETAIALFSSPEPEVDYVAKANEISKPADYDANRNAALDYEKAFAVVTEEPNWLRDWRKVWPGDMNDEQREVLEEWVEENAGALEHFERGARKPYYWSEYQGDFMMDAAFLPKLKGFRYAAYTTMARARLKAANGDVRGALEGVLVCYRTDKHLGGKKTLIEQLVGIAVKALGVNGARDILARAEVDGKMLAWFEEELGGTLEKERGVDMTLERLMFLDVVQRLYTGGIMGNRIMSVGAARHYGVAWGLWSRKDVVQNYNEMCAYYERLKGRRPYELNLEDEDLGDRVEEAAGKNSLTSVLMPALDKVNEMFWRTQAGTDALVTLVGVLRYREQKGEVPENLEAVVEAGYLKEILQDPFGEGALSYRRDGDDFVLYSWGLDMDDDGGKRGEKKWGKEGDEVFWPVVKSE